DDSRMFAERASQAGVEVRLDVFPEMLHSFQMMAGRAPEADDAIRRLADWVAPKLDLQREGTRMASAATSKEEDAMYLVVGATGPVGLGGEICRQLRAAGQPVRALGRPTANADRVADLTRIGVEFVSGDLKKPRSLHEACRGIETVVSTASMMVSHQDADTVENVDGTGQGDLVDAADAAGVRSFVYLSFSQHIDRDFPFRNAKRAVEQRLKHGRLAYTILRPTFLMEVWLSPIAGFDFDHAHARIYGQGRNPISWISMDDVARFAVRSLGAPLARNATFELGGPEA